MKRRIVLCAAIAVVNASGTDGAAQLGHHDRMGLGGDDAAKSWNSSHTSRGGCNLEALKSTGGAGLLYCFATN